MLVLNRKGGEIIDFQVGDVKFSLTVMKAWAGHVSLGFDAPQSVRIVRREARKQESKREPV